MNIIKKVCLAFAVALAACGAPGYEEPIDGEPSDELGTIEQGYSAKNNPSFQYGANTSSAHLRCNKTSSGQVCSVPREKGAFYCIDSGFSADDKTTVRNAISTIDNALSTWSFLENPACDAYTMKFTPGSVAGTLSSNIDGYNAKTLFVPTTALTEGSGVVGQYQSHSPVEFFIDVADCNNKFASATGKVQCKRHAAGNILLSWIGLGSRTDSGANGTFERRSLAPEGTVLSAMTSGSDCAAESYNATNTGTYFIQSSGCLTD